MEKKLNLLTLLKGCENETVYMPDKGNCKVTQVNEDSIEVFVKDACRPTNLAAETLEIKPTGFAYAYPSRESFLAHPLDAYTAWMEWAEARKPKIWHPDPAEEAWCLDLNINPHEKRCMVFMPVDWYYGINCFRTEELCKQAAEAVRETLMKFHETHPQG